MKPTVRPARIDEADALTALCVRSKRSNGYDATFMAACLDELMVTPARLKAGNFWVAEVAGDDVLCGCAGLTMGAGKRIGKVGMFFVDPEWQGRGAGRALWAAIVDCAQENGLRKLYLDSDPFAEAYYRKLGFEMIGRVPSGSMPGRTLPRMEITLPAC